MGVSRGGCCGAPDRGDIFRLGTEQVRSPVQSGVAGGHAKWFRALPAVAPPKRRSVTECRPMTPGAGPSAETECEANARAPTPKRGTPRLRHADTDPYPLRLLSIGDIGSRTRRRRLTGKRTLSMCRSSYQPLRSGSASEAILCSGD